MNLRKTFVGLAAACILGTAGMAMNGMETYAAEKPEYLKSVTYFGDEWPINYWGSEDRNMEANFARIRADGFNSIILVVPWREFQPMDSEGEFNEVSFARLNEIMICAEKYDLWVTLRIGYSWDYYGDSELPSRFAGVTKHNGVDRNMWLRYCERIYQEASAHPNFHSGFITWEDFWDYVHNMSREYSRRTTAKMARECGYQAYLEQHYSLAEVSGIYKENFESFREIYIPYRNQVAAVLFFEYYDQMLNGLLAHTQTVFPGLSLEVRADGDPVYQLDKSFYYYSHDMTYSCNGAEYTALMYSVSMGQRNESDRISAAAALAAMERNMNALYGMSGKKFFVEQLLYMDSTQEFSYNTQIHEEETDDFVRALAPVLEQSTMGYGLWVYRNYVNNCVYNGQFRLGKEGWKFYGSSVTNVDGTPMVRMENGSRIMQELRGRMTRRENIYVDFYAKPEEAGTVVTVKIGGTEIQAAITGAGTYKLELPWQNHYDLEIFSNGAVLLDDIRVYTYEQYGRIYNRDGSEQDLADDFRILNSQLP